MISRRIISLTPLALALTLSGCSIGPDYLRPQSWLPALFTEAPTATAQTDTEAAAVDSRWWALFKDDTLSSLIEAAHKENADLRLAVARVEQADAAARESGASLFPTLNGSANGSNTGLSEKTATWSANSPSVLRSRSAGVSLSYELDVWGRVRRANEAARASLLASRYGRDSVRLSVAGLVASNYLNLRALDAQLAITAESLKSREESSRLTKVRVDAGLSSPLDQYQADGALAAVQAQQADLRQARALAEHQLALLTGNPSLKIAAGDLRQMPLPPVPPTGLPAQLIENRPDIRQAEQNLIASNANIGVAKAAYYPKFSLTGALGSESKTLSDLFSAGAGTWSLGLGLLMPIFDAGRTAAQVDQARALNQQSLINWQYSLQVAYKEVRDALVKLRENAAGEAAQAQRADAAAKALQVAQKRYEAGYSGYMEVLDAQRSSNDAQLAAIASRQARLSAAVELFKALGGGWQADAS